jgi:hypothetical protein
MFKEDAIANLIFLPAVIVVGLLAAILVPGAMKNPKGYTAAVLALYGVGLVFFALAKIQNIRNGHLLSFGSLHMSTPWKWVYRFGYTLMGLGLLLTMVLGVIGQFKR